MLHEKVNWHWAVFSAQCQLYNSKGVTTMDISTIISKEIIFLDLEAHSRAEVIDSLIDGIAKNGYVIDKDEYRAAVEERESKGTTGIGFGVAIPHGKSKAVKSPCVAFARLQTPVDWNSFDGKPVNTVFMIAVPQENAGNDHLKILIAISKKLMHEEFRSALEKATTPDEILDVIKTIDK